MPGPPISLANHYFRLNRVNTNRDVTKIADMINDLNKICLKVIELGSYLKYCLTDPHILTPIARPIVSIAKINKKNPANSVTNCKGIESLNTHSNNKI
jgi:hypothetical protein